MEPTQPNNTPQPNTNDQPNPPDAVLPQSTEPANLDQSNSETQPSAPVPQPAFEQSIGGTAVNSIQANNQAMANPSGQQFGPPNSFAPQNNVVYSGQPMTTQNISPLPPQNKKPKNKLLLALGIVFVIIILLAGSAFAYMELVVNQKPEVRLAKSIEHFMSQKSANIDGSFETASDSLSVNVGIKGAYDINSQTSEATMTIGVAGMRVPVNLKFVNKSLYFMLDDTKAITDYVSSFLGAYSESYTSIPSLDGKWFVVDKSAFTSSKEASECYDKISALTPAEYSAIADAYKQHPFVTITSATNVEKDGKKLLKVELSNINKAEFDAFAAQVKLNGTINAALECYNTSDVSDDSNSGVDAEQKIADIANKTKGTWYLYINSNNQIDSVEGTVTDDSTKATVALKLDYTKPVDVKAPDNPEPIQNLLQYFMPTE